MDIDTFLSVYGKSLYRYHHVSIYSIAKRMNIIFVQCLINTLNSNYTLCTYNRIIIRIEPVIIDFRKLKLLIDL